MRIEVRIADWRAEQAVLLEIRREVFQAEQGVPAELELDGADPSATHCLALDPAGAPIGTGRITPDGKIGRMAVRRAWRGQGVGAGILDGLIKKARQMGLEAVYLHAQLGAHGLYRRAGFVATGPVFEEAGIDHVLMRRTL